MTWMVFWKVCFFLVLGVFAFMSVLVSILGARDVRRFLRRLKEEPEPEEDQELSEENRSE